MTRAGRRGQSLDLNKISCWSWSMKPFIHQDPTHFQSTRTHTSGVSHYNFDRVSNFHASRQIFACNDGNPIAALKEHWKWAKSAEANGIIRGVEHFIKNKQTKREKPCRKVGGKQQWVWRSLPACSRSVMMIPRYNRTNDNGIFVTSSALIDYDLFPGPLYSFTLAGDESLMSFADHCLCSPWWLQTSCRGWGEHISSRTICLSAAISLPITDQ